MLYDAATGIGGGGAAGSDDDEDDDEDDAAAAAVAADNDEDDDDDDEGSSVCMASSRLEARCALPLFARCSFSSCVFRCAAARSRAYLSKNANA
jgi:hypothetical protein